MASIFSELVVFSCRRCRRRRRRRRFYSCCQCDGARARKSSLLAQKYCVLKNSTTIEIQSQLHQPAARLLYVASGRAGGRAGERTSRRATTSTRRHLWHHLHLQCKPLLQKVNGEPLLVSSGEEQQRREDDEEVGSGGDGGAAGGGAHESMWLRWVML